MLAESYQQHAEHYFRVLRAVQPQRLVGEIMNRDAFASGYDIDFEDESGGEGEAQAEPVEAEAERPDNRGEWRQENRQENRYERPRDDQRPRDDRPRDRSNGGGGDRNNNSDRNNAYRDDRGGDRPQQDRARDDRPQENRARDDRPREDRYRDDRPRDDRPQENRARDDRARDDRQRNNDRNDRYRDDRRPERGNERNNDPLPVVEPQATPLISEVEQPGSPILRSQDGGISQAPAFLQARGTPVPEADNDGEARPKARRKRAPRGLDGDNAAPAADVTEDA